MLNLYDYFQGDHFITLLFCLLTIFHVRLRKQIGGGDDDNDDNNNNDNNNNNNNNDDDDNNNNNNNNNNNKSGENKNEYNGAAASNDGSASDKSFRDKLIATFGDDITKTIQKCLSTNRRKETDMEKVSTFYFFYLSAVSELYCF